MGFNYDADFWRDYLPVAHLNAIPALSAPFAHRGLVDTRDFISSHDYEHLDIYNLFFRPRDELNSSMGLWVYRDGEDVAMLTVDIPRRYSEQDRQKLERSLRVIFPHLKSAFALMMDLELKRDRPETAVFWLETIPTAAYLVNRNCKVLEMNEAGMRLAGSEDCSLAIGRNRMVRSGAAAVTKAIEARVRRVAMSLVPEGPFAIPDGDRPRLSGYCIPVGTGSQRDSVLRHFRDRNREVLLVVADADEVLSNPPEIIETALGLTPAEARIVSALSNGGGLREAADAAGIGYNTARSQVASASAKLGVGRQTELVARAVRAVGAVYPARRFTRK
ncbi:MAG: hypothetical protein KUA43_15630 [Hoeflea sp.]|uniref:helix-turn-helix transcriptional regulator n=1 Tax=Hoeflea sp. TaxID=1940281 RepID=UPI001D2381F7|nr:hypothetical protein [Hoeflea sp.]MBU4531593.1 hypothetical protein [Alphaproteobacteria bacterium]MBU4544450.1 hypothetical protein [Alphaproteobacteria bacterium]MBU4550313.1 hypothetical protein [Alphaproteobacteria bacterium]MBV1724869.1 hypothetical protein [Hoeflea sp.]MBV1760889.1 hypothetical protein [Hoeflea sp.]